MLRKYAAIVLTLGVLAACGGGGGGGSSTAPVVGAATPSGTATATPSAKATATATPSTAPTSSATSNPAAFVCPTTTAAAVARSGNTSSATDASRHAARSQRVAPEAGSTTQLALFYQPGAANVPASGSVSAPEAAAGARYVSQLTLANSNQLIRVVSVPTASVATAESTLRAQSGVTSVAVTGGRRYPTTVTTPYYPNDPYFRGFTTAQNAQAGLPSLPATFQVLPYVEAASIPGQWDMHVIGLERAFGYSQTGNGSSIVNASALGSANVKIAIIDTGVDQTHPELSSKITLAKCFITNPSGVQSTGTFSNDHDGHGTDVAGIAAAATNNGFGFTAAGGNAVIYAYRVFPTPDDNCTNPNSTDAQCGGSTTDIASAINDAVKNGANIISLSLGGTTCGTGTSYAPNGDSDTVEGAAIAAAIAAKVIVVAASGNSGGAGVAAPACDTGVIAAGASALDDGTANATGTFGGTSATPVEYVPSYSQYGTPGTAYRSASAWGIVAPGGDPSSNNDTDDLHWIENIWTSTPFMSSASDTAFAGQCTDDYPNSNGTTSPVDCRTLIAGTSMSTPHVAGAAALILAVSGSTYASPTAMKALLCGTADDIGQTKNEGCGRLNVYRAMAVALGDPSPP